jgi:glycine/D-amino acid oxidase-like deaminating enzyme
VSDDLIIVGGGIVGAACAEACARAGLKTLLLERDLIGGGVTGTGMGHLVMMDDSEAQFAISRDGVERWRARAATFPAEVEYDPCGTLWLAADADELALAERRAAFYTNRGIIAEVVDARRLRELEPNLAGDLVGGLRLPGDAVLYPPAAARFLVAEACAAGARWEQATVTAVTPGAVQTADGRTLLAGRILVAAGTATPTLVPGTPVRPRKGQLVITDRYPAYVRHQLVELGYMRGAYGASASAASVAFNIQPRRTGQMLLGSSRQFDDDGAVDAELLDRMIRRAQRFLPGITSLQALRCWTGLRPASPDHLPMIGPADTDGKIWLAAGHEGLGITTALSSAALVAALLTGAAPTIPAEPYHPGRFAHQQAGHG